MDGMKYYSPLNSEFIYEKLRVSQTRHHRLPLKIQHNYITNIYKH